MRLEVGQPSPRIRRTGTTRPIQHTETPTGRHRGGRRGRDRIHATDPACSPHAALGIGIRHRNLHSVTNVDRITSFSVSISHSSILAESLGAGTSVERYVTVSRAG